jgi:AsmA protein
MNDLKLQTSASGQMIPVDQVELSLTGDVDFALNTQQLAVKGFATRIGTQGGVMQQVKAELAGEIGFDVGQQLLTVGALDLTAELTDPSMPKGKINSGVSASRMTLNLEKHVVDLADLVLSLNENRFNGFVKVKDYTRPSAEFALAAREFNVDKLMGDEAGPQQAAEQAPAPTTEEDVQIALPMELLRSLQLNGKLEIGRLVAQKLTFTNLLLQVNADNGVLDLKPLKMDLYDGKFDGAVQVNAQGEKPVYSVSQKLSSFQIGSFLQDFMGDDKISGNANMDINLSTGGEWLSELKSHLDGDMHIAIYDGALKGFNLRHKVEAAKARFKGQKAPELEAKKTDFSALSLSGVVKQGVFSSDDLKIEAPLIRVGGQGSANLGQETVDYLVDAKLVGTVKGQQGGEAGDLSGLDIPVKITGPWLEPDIDVQYDDMMKARLDTEKARIREQIAREKAEVQKELEAQKAKLKAAEEKKLAAEKERLQKQKELKEAELKAELEARKKAEKEKTKKKLEDKLQKLF